MKKRKRRLLTRYPSDKAQKQLRAYRRKAEIPAGTRFYFWPTGNGYITSGDLPDDYMWTGQKRCKAKIYTVCKIYESENSFGPFFDIWLTEDGVEREAKDCIIVNGPDAFRLTRVPAEIPELTEESVMSMMSEYSLDIMDGWRNLVSSTDLMRRFFVTRYKARKMLHALEEKGLIRKDTYSGITDDGNVFCYHGYVITEKGKELPVYKRAAYKEAKIDAESFGQGKDMPEYFRAIIKNSDLREKEKKYV